MAEKTTDPKDIERMQETIEVWLNQIENLRQQPEFEHSTFFDLLTSIIVDAKNGRRRNDLLENCLKAAGQAEELYNSTQNNQFLSWMTALLEYAETWKADGATITFSNPLLQAELKAMQYSNTDGHPDPLRRFVDAFKQMNEYMKTTSMYDYESMKQASEKMQELTAPIEDLRKYAQMFSGTEYGDKLNAMLDETENNLRVLVETTTAIEEENTKEFLRCLDEEIRKPQYNGLSINELREQSKDENGNIIEDSLFMQACDAANATLEERLSLAKTSVIKPVDFLLPLDKLNRNIWKLLETETGQQLTFAAEKAGSKKEIDILYSINFDALPKEVKITKKVTAFDRRVHTAVSALFNAGNTVMTLTQIHYAMGNTSSPNKVQIKKIDESLTKMRTAIIYINNADEAKFYKYPIFVYDGNLLPFERQNAIVNGKKVDAAIRVFREPPLTEFAKKRNQITTLPLKLLQSPVNKNDTNLPIEDYLLERIAMAKNGRGINRILLATLCEECGITSRSQKSKLPNKLKVFMDYYVSLSHIKRYTIDDKALTFFY